MENQTVTAPELKLFAYDAKYARSKKTFAFYWTLDLVKGLSMLAVVGVAFLCRNVIPHGTSMYIPFVLGLLAAALIIYFIFKGFLRRRTDAWFCSFAQRDGKFYHLEFVPRQGPGVAGFLSSLFDAAHCEMAISAAANTAMVDIAIACREAGVDVPSKSDYKKIEITELPDAKLTLKGKKITVTYTGSNGKPEKLVTDDCFVGLVEAMK